MKITLSLIILFLFSQSSFSQIEGTHRWKKLDTDDNRKLWYDVSDIDSIKGDRFNIWVLEVHTPPLKSEGIDGEIYRSLILYSVNLITVKYGIMKIRYYSSANKELFAFDYDTPPPPTDALRFPYPVLENSPVYFVIKELFKYRKGTIN